RDSTIASAAGFARIVITAAAWQPLPPRINIRAGRITRRWIRRGYAEPQIRGRSEVGLLSRRNGNHPAHNGTGVDQAEARRKECLGKWHPHLPAIGGPAKRRLASSATETDSAKPGKAACPWHIPSDASTVVSPRRKLACMILSSLLGRTMAGPGYP